MKILRLCIADIEGEDVTNVRSFLLQQGSDAPFSLINSRLSGFRQASSPIFFLAQ